MLVGRFTSLWSSMLRGCHRPIASQTKPSGVSARNGAVQRICRSTFAKAGYPMRQDGDKAFAYSLCAYGQQPRLVVEGKVFGLELRRGLHSYAVGGDWPRSVEKASSWDAVFSEEKAMRKLLFGTQYSEMVEACEKRLLDLYRAGVLSADGLRPVVRRLCGEWQSLFVVVGFVSRLTTADTSTRDMRFFIAMSAFVYALNMHPGHSKAMCERLQPLVNIFEKNTKALPAKCVLSTVSSFAHVDCPELSLYKLMVGVEQLYKKRLGELSPEELLWLTAGSSRISVRGEKYSCVSLCSDLLEEFYLRLTDFPPPKAAQMLSSLAFVLPADHMYQCRMEQAFCDIENYLAPSLSNQKSKVIVQLAASFNHFGYQAQKISFRDLLYERMGSLNERQIKDIFHYVSKCSAVDEALLRRLQGYVPKKIFQWAGMSISLWMTSLAMSQVVDVPGCKELAHVFQEDIVRRMSENGDSFSSVQCAGLLFALVRLRLGSSQAIDQLYPYAMRDFSGLPGMEMVQFMFGVSQLKGNEKYVTDLHAAIRKTEIRDKHLTLQGRGLVCKAFVAMRLVDQQWLQEIVRLSRIDLHTSLLTNFARVSLVLWSLSFLGWSCVELCEEAGSWLDGQAGMGAEFVWSSEMVDILWACAMQGIFPCQTLEQLQSCKPPVLGKLKYEDILRLRDLSVLVQQQHRINILPPETYLSVLHQVGKDNQVLPCDIRACMEDIGLLFPSGHVRVDVMTAEGVRVECTLLKNRDGTSIEWPSSAGQKLSAADAQKLQDDGYQPLAVCVLGPAWLDLSQNLFGPALAKCNVLKACGWDVLFISSSEYMSAADKQRFLRSEFELSNKDGFAVRISADNRLSLSGSAEGQEHTT